MQEQTIDSFFIGEASANALLAKISPSSSHFLPIHQLYIPAKEKFTFDIEDDLQRFADEPTFDYNIKETFYTAKKKAYGYFNYVEILASCVGDVPVREQDLIVGENDLYIIDYLTKNKVDKYALETIATLMAYESMGLYFAKFHTDCQCPVCRNFDGQIIETDSTIRLLSSGGYITHCGPCSCSPIVYREFYTGPLAGHLDIDQLSIVNLLVNSVPIELQSELSVALMGIVDPQVKQVNLINMAEFLKDSKDSSGIVIYCESDTLWVHNSYVGNLGPVEFIAEWLKAEQVESVNMDDLRDCVVYFIKGVRAAKYKGFYWNVETGEKVK